MSRKPPKSSDQTQRSGGVRPIAASVPKIAAKAIGRRGFAEASLITDWDTVVGPELAAASQPVKLGFPPGERANGTLHIRVQGGVATELQHLEPLVVERINGHFGYGAVARLKLIHAPIGRRPPRKAERTPPAVDAAGRERLDSLLADVEDPEIRRALERLGGRLLDRAARIKKT